MFILSTHLMEITNAPKVAEISDMEIGSGRSEIL